MRTRISDDLDIEAILLVHLDAFGPQEGPEIVDLVRALFRDNTAEPRLSIVAESGGRLAGHILFSTISIDLPSERPAGAILAPLAVSREFQRQGVGSQLVNEGLETLAGQGVDLAFVLGHPGYYPRFGFQPAGPLGFEAPYPIAKENSAAWMIKPLTQGAEAKFAGQVVCAASLNEEKHWVE